MTVIEIQILQQRGIGAHRNGPLLLVCSVIFFTVHNIALKFCQEKVNLLGIAFFIVPIRNPLTITCIIKILKEIFNFCSRG